MGKKRIIKKSGQNYSSDAKNRALSRSSKKKMDRAILFVNASYNNTMITLADVSGGSCMQSSSGALGFKGSKKGTPFAASKVAEVLAEKAQTMGVKEVDIVVKGVGAGRESSIRSFIAKGIGIGSIKDVTPIPFNGPKSPRARRV